MRVVVLFLFTICGWSSFADRTFASERTTAKLVDTGVPTRLNREAMLGDVLPAQGVFALRSATPGTVDEFGSHYISIAALAEVILAQGDFHFHLKMGLVKLSARPGPVLVSLKIGTHWYEFALDDQKFTVRGVRLDTVRRDEMEMSYVVPITLKGEPFTLDVVRNDGMVSIRLNDTLLRSFWAEPTGGDLAICVERESLLRVATSTNDTKAELRIYDWTVTAHFEKSSASRRRWEQLAGHRWRVMKRIGDAYGYQEDDPGLPNVLLIGDSISIYYTDTVRRLLAGQADVYRTPMGPGKAETLFASLDDFLAQGQWDVIHFNSGLHDFSRKEPTEANLQEYRNNLKIIVGKLRRTGAKLIWASTTPVPAKAPASVTDDARCQRFNATALTLMEEEDIPVNNLYSAILPEHSKYWMAPNNIHFNSAGSAFLGRRVANALLPLLNLQVPP